MLSKILPAIVVLLVAAVWAPCRGQVGVIVYEEGTFLPDDDPAPPRPVRFFVGVDFELVYADLDQRLRGPVDLGGGVIDIIELPNADLDVDLALRLEFGWHLWSGAGDLSIVLRGLSAEGNDFREPRTIETFLELDVVDLDFTSRRWTFDPAWSVRWRAGARFARVHFDTFAESWFVGQRVSNTFRGAGAHLGVETEAAVGPGLRFIAKVDGSAMGGSIRQDFDEIFFFGPVVVLAGTTVREDQFVPVLAAELGLGWDAPWSVFGLNFAAGYRFERWWNVGDVFDSRADLNIHGLFFRAQWNF